MSKLFCGCSGLEELDLSNFKTDHVTDMSSIFANCSLLNKLNLSKFEYHSSILSSNTF